MLEIVIPPIEGWDEEKQEFVTTKGATLLLEHSLISLSKWEAKWNKPFLDKNDKTNEETIDYIRCMTLNKNVDPDVYNYISQDNIMKIYEYIQAPMTATTFNTFQKKSFDRTIVTSELIYYWMVALNIPFECEKWHINRLLTLIRVCEVKNAPPKKMSKRELMNQYASLNASRRKKYNSKG